MNTKKTLLTSTGIVLGIFLIILIAANSAAFTYSPLLSQFLGVETYKVDDTGSNEEISNIFSSDYTSYKTLVSDQEEFAKNVQIEGSVLLKNDADFPIKKEGNITLLGAGTAQTNSANTGFICTGGGSGGIDISKIPSLYDVFSDAGYNVNTIMWEYYNDGAGKSTRRVADGTVGEQQLSNMTNLEIDSIKSYSDVGIVVIGRPGNEGSDLPFYSSEDPTKSYLELSQNEIDLIDMATEEFKQTVVLLNTMSSIDISSIMDKNITIIWIGAGGQKGILALPDILNGNANPSGHLNDTFATNLINTPAAINQGDFKFTNVDMNDSNHYYVYAEGIYTGYHYYETRYADVVMNTPNAGVYHYSTEVAFPFGFGLSYTTFEYSNFKLSESSYNFIVNVTVKNSGNVAGKDSVQIYMQSPYTEYDKNNGIEKSAVELAGFTKTKEINPGDSKTVTIEIPKDIFRAYDAKNMKTYIVDDGIYYFAVGNDSHDALNNILNAQGYTVNDGMTEQGNSTLVGSYTQESFDAETYAYNLNGEKITNQFDNVDINYYDSTFKYLTRSDWAGTFPKPYGGDDKQSQATEVMIKDMAIPLFGNGAGDLPATNSEQQLTLASLIGVEYNNEFWDTLLDQLSVEDMWKLVCEGGFKTASIESINKPGTVDKDGPAGITSQLIGGASSFGYPMESLLACTWNIDFATQMGNFIGEDGLITGTSGWYAPSVNMHRSAFSGRNFEYYSEDSLVSGRFASEVIKNASKKGVYAYLKHFFLNDQETNRTSACTFSNEQALREYYLEPFEIAVKEDNASAIMSSYNRIGAVWTGHHKGLLTNVLRNEWNFTGMVLTDYMVPSSYDDVIAGLMAGQDIWLNTSSAPAFNGGDSSSVVKAMRESVHRILYTVANSNAMNGISVNTKIIPITPVWVYFLIIADVILLALIVLGFVRIKKKQIVLNNEENNVDSNSITALICKSSLIATAVGFLMELIGGLFLSPSLSVGLNTNISPLMFAGLGITFLSLIYSIINQKKMDKKKIIYNQSYIATVAAMFATLIGTLYLVFIIVIPVIIPANG